MLKETADTLLQKPVHKFQITVPVGYLRKKEVVKEYEIKSLNLHSMIKISEEVLSIDKDILKEGKQMLSSAYKILHENGESLIRIVAYGILNSDKEPSDKLLKDLGYMSSEDLLNAFIAIVQQINVAPFISSIIYIANVNVMETNPKDQGSQIASGVL